MAAVAWQKYLAITTANLENYNNNSNKTNFFYNTEGNIYVQKLFNLILTGEGEGGEGAEITYV